jgi:hypothetical protein
LWTVLGVQRSHTDRSLSSLRYVVFANFCVTALLFVLVYLHAVRYTSSVRFAVFVA